VLALASRLPGRARLVKAINGAVVDRLVGCSLTTVSRRPYFGEDVCGTSGQAAVDEATGELLEAPAGGIGGVAQRSLPGEYG
jgi:hypothetical protein